MGGPILTIYAYSYYQANLVKYQQLDILQWAAPNLQNPMLCNGPDTPLKVSLSVGESGPHL